MTAPAPISPIEMRLKRAENCKNLRHFLAPLRRIAWFPIFQAGCPECAHTPRIHSQVVDFAQRICKIKSTQKNPHQLPWIFCGVKICSKMWCGLFGVDFILVSAPLGWFGLCRFCSSLVVIHPPLLQIFHSGVWESRVPNPLLV